MKGYQIAITRAKSFYGCSKKYDVELDGISVGRLENGKTLVIHTAAGPHTIAFLAFRRIEKSISISVQPEQYMTRLSAKLDVYQKLDISSEAQAMEATYKETRDEMNSNLTICKTCGHGIAKGANKCPNCGAAHRQVTQTVFALILALIFVATVGLIASTLGADDRKPDAAFADGRQQTTSDPAPIAISASDLWDAYSANTVNADAQFKDQIVSVTGTITNIGQDIATKKPCVSVDSGDWVSPIQCFFSDADQTEIVASLQDGQKVAIIGKCTGVAIVSVQLTDCYISN